MERERGDSSLSETDREQHVRSFALAVGFPHVVRFAAGEANIVVANVGEAMSVAGDIDHARR